LQKQQNFMPQLAKMIMCLNEKVGVGLLDLGQNNQMTLEPIQILWGRIHAQLP